MKNIFIPILMVIGCAAPAMSSVIQYKHLYYPNNINVYKIETTKVEYKNSPAVNKDDSITVRYLKQEPKVKKVHNFAIRRF